MSNSNGQSSLFNENAFSEIDTRTVRQWDEKRMRAIEELRVGQWDYERLLPERERYAATVARWRGITQFKYSQNKFDALEARAIIRFLNEWASRSENLKVEIEECERMIESLP